MCVPLIRKENENKTWNFSGNKFVIYTYPSWDTYCKTNAQTLEKEWTILGHDIVRVLRVQGQTWKSCNVCLPRTKASSFDTLASSSLSSSIRDIINDNIIAATTKMTTATKQMKTLKMIRIRQSFPRLGLSKVSSLIFSIVRFTFVNLFPLLLQIISDLFRDVRFIHSINKKNSFLLFVLAPGILKAAIVAKFRVIDPT